eukprot:9270137-Pyramimonas_sp.AAC.1
MTSAKTAGGARTFVQRRCNDRGILRPSHLQLPPGAYTCPVRTLTQCETRTHPLYSDGFVKGSLCQVRPTRQHHQLPPKRRAAPACRRLPCRAQAAECETCAVP